MAALNVSETRLIHAHEERTGDTNSMIYESDEGCEIHELQTLLKYHKRQECNVSNFQVICILKLDTLINQFWSL